MGLYPATRNVNPLTTSSTHQLRGCPIHWGVPACYLCTPGMSSICCRDTVCTSVFRSLSRTSWGLSLPGKQQQVLISMG